ncbi:MAG: hypothetical protein AAB599_01045 [Patescibacteria group bacterium]
MFRLPGFSTFELTVVIGFLFVVTAVFVFFVDPVERARQKRDARLAQDAQEVLDSLGKFYISFGRVPWSDRVNPVELSPALSWKSLRVPEVGICADNECKTPGELVTSKKLSERFLTTDSVLGRNGTVYISKGSGPKVTIYACFVPESKVTRRKNGELFKINLEAEFPKNGTLASCPSATSWVEEDVCYTCVAK